MKCLRHRQGCNFSKFTVLFISVGFYILDFYLQELERKSQVKLNTLLEIEAKAQARWKDEKIFEEDAPPVNLYYTCFIRNKTLWL